MSAPTTAVLAMTPQNLLDHWQGHRRLTRRVIEAFPDDQLFTFSVGGMRPFGVLAMEIITMSGPMVRGMVTDQWAVQGDRNPRPKAELLTLWDETTKEIESLWPQIRPEKFQEKFTAFGQYEDLGVSLISYVVDNEIHHRGQGYVYLRALGIAPPAFWER